MLYPSADLSRSSLQSIALLEPWTTLEDLQLFCAPRILVEPTRLPGQLQFLAQPAAAEPACDRGGGPRPRRRRSRTITWHDLPQHSLFGFTHIGSRDLRRPAEPSSPPKHRVLATQPPRRPLAPPRSLPATQAKSEEPPRPTEEGQPLFTTQCVDHQLMTAERSYLYLYDSAFLHLTLVKNRGLRSVLLWTVRRVSSPA